ncbi:MAG: DUF3486 family protein [Desulfovibrio sp.]|jgi:predicted ATP-dependent protease|nr:DUF3486 family protein [Desulfovibrio sp.]
MGRKSSILLQPVEVRDEINERMDGGATLDEVIAWLRGNGIKDVSRTALWRYAQQLDRIMAKARRSRMLAEVMVRSLKKMPENRLVQANVEAMHGVLMQLIDAAENDEKVTIDSKDALNLSRSIAALAQAEKANADKVIQVEKYVSEAPLSEEGPGVIEINLVRPEKQK